LQKRLYIYRRIVSFWLDFLILFWIITSAGSYQKCRREIHGFIQPFRPSGYHGTAYIIDIFGLSSFGSYLGSFLLQDFILTLQKALLKPNFLFRSLSICGCDQGDFNSSL
jgi:hypothetical protein